MTNGLTPLSHQAFRDLLDTMWEGVELTRATAVDERDSAEGYRFITHMLRAGLELFLDNDPLRPHFAPMIVPKLAQPWAVWSAPLEMWGPNPYTIYDVAPIEGSSTYRIWGNRGTVRYLGIALYSGGGWTGVMPKRIGDSLNHTNLVTNADGSFEIIIGARRPGNAQNFLEIDPDAHSVLIRQFFADPEREAFARYAIERVPSAGPPPPLTDDEMARRIRSVIESIRETGTDFLKAFGRPMPVLDQETMPPNQFDLAALDTQITDLGRARRGGTGFMYINPDHWYLACSYDLESDEALVIDLEPPDCEWWGLYAFNRYMQTHEYRHGAHNLVSIGNAVTNEREIVTIVVAHEDPSTPNWIWTEQRPTGILIIRWTITGIDQDGAPSVPRPTTRVVKLGELMART